MLRVVATIINSDYADEYSAQTANLTSWIIEIVEAAFQLQRVSFGCFLTVWELPISSKKRDLRARRSPGAQFLLLTAKTRILP